MGPFRTQSSQHHQLQGTEQWFPNWFLLTFGHMVSISSYEMKLPEAKNTSVLFFYDFYKQSITVVTMTMDATGSQGGGREMVHERTVW